VWGTSSEDDNATWGCAGEDAAPFDDPDTPSVFDGTTDVDGVFATSGGDTPPPPDGSTAIVGDAPLATTDSSLSSIDVIVTGSLTAIAGGF